MFWVSLSNLSRVSSTRLVGQESATSTEQRHKSKHRKQGAISQQASGLVRCMWNNAQAEQRHSTCIIAAWMSDVKLLMPNTSKYEICFHVFKMHIPRRISNTSTCIPWVVSCVSQRSNVTSPGVQTSSSKTETVWAWVLVHAGSGPLGGVICQSFAG
jgi:hypothetical protein